MTDQIAASHILLMHSESERSSATRSKSEALELIGDIKNRIDAGEDFNILAKETSSLVFGKKIERSASRLYPVMSKAKTLSFLSKIFPLFA